MGQNYLLIEGVNLDATIYDTNQLSIIRGSSFLYKEAVEKIYKKFADQLTALSTGASVGLFQIKDPAEIEALKKGVINFINSINEDHDYRHLSILVETCEADDLLKAKQILQTQLRWRQLQALSQVPDKEYLQYRLARDQVSQLEGIRIAHTGNSPIIQGAKHISLSEKVRWNKGRSEKQNYYTSLIKQIDNSLSDALRYYSFATTIQDLCDCKAYSQLDGKMAVIYIDGNGFGKRQTDYLKKAITNNEDGTKAQQVFDEAIQLERAKYLAKTLTDFIDEDYPNGLGYNEESSPIIRLETLLWGGDEMLFVLPAWLGFEFLQRFYQSAETWKLSDGAPLTHAAGIVFCKAKSPIRIIQKLAKALAERVKEECSREQSAWDYMVLESMDYPTDIDLTEYFQARYRGLATTRPTGHFIDKQPNNPDSPIQESLAALLKLTTAHQLFRLSETLQTHGSAGSYEWQDLANKDKNTPLTQQEEQEQRLLAVMATQEARSSFIRLSKQVAEQLFSLKIQDSAQQRAWFWLHLLELWNYLLPKTKQDTQGVAA